MTKQSGNILPPKWADKLLMTFLPEDLAEELQGDMHEQFEVQVEEMGLKKAQWLYAFEVLQFCRPYFLKRRLMGKTDDYPPVKIFSLIMISNYFKIARRHLFRHKTFSAINLLGLAVGLGVCMMIILYVQHEYNFDRFHRNVERIHWVRTKIRNGEDSLFMPRMSYATAPLMQRSNAFVESFVRVMKGERNTLIQKKDAPEQKFLEDKFMFADSNFFSFFSFKLLEGDPKYVLNEPFTMVLSEETAEKYFGSTANAMGKVLQYKGGTSFTVRGVAEKAPSNSSIEYDLIASLASVKSMEDKKGTVKSQIVETGPFTTYFLLRNPQDATKVEAGLLQLYRTGNPNGKNNKNFMAIPLSQTHLMSNYGGISTSKYLKIFPFVALLILLLSLTNYMNLSTARSFIRAKEIGIRKTIGASRNSITLQFYIESALYTIISFIAGYILCLVLQPVFFRLLNITIDKNFLFHPYVTASFAGLFFISVFLAGSYPSLLLSAYSPVVVLYGKINRRIADLSTRNFITVFQFSISVVLIICSLIIGKQLYFFKNSDTGIKHDNIISIPFTSSVAKHYNTFKRQVESLAGVQQVSTSQYSLYDGYDMFTTKTKNSQENTSLATITVDENYIPMLGLQWKSAPVNPQFYQTPNTIILNEAAIKKLNLKTSRSVYERIDINETPHEIAGVIKDFNYESLHDKIDGLCLIIRKDTASSWQQGGGCLLVKTKANTSTSELIGRMKTIYESYESSSPFKFYFMDDVVESMYKSEDRISKIFNGFTIVTIFIACLGLLGLSILSTEQRTKEIGIRKVLGASVFGVVSLLSKDFLKLVLIAIVIASPIAYYFMQEWLKDFPYRTAVNWWIFALAGFVSVLIALLTVSFQSVKAALANPVKSLKSE
ncbi:ABC transporter permease [Emticicia sp. BO119]|uniref:ABC transporter permease n=1 Tax=Emticicia sp. BO119 TaxID=2757768 RepID=UPI0015F083D5|nr:ABC transporter permease [Emticicia sp. BO119]MBA4849338.1 ABC transporter permease [Emticicia sp. BO119]